MNLTDIIKIIAKYWKHILIIAGIAGFALMIYISVTVSNRQLREAEKNSNSNLNKFNLVASWKGTNGEVVRSLTTDGTNIFVAVGFDGLYIFDNAGLNFKYSFSTNYCINDIAIKSFASNTYAFLAVGTPDSDGGLIICDITDLTNIRIINSAIMSNTFIQSLCTYSDTNDQGRFINIFMTDEESGFTLFSYDVLTNTLILKNTGTGRNYRGIDIDAEKGIICSTSKDGSVYLYNWKGKVLSKISNSLSMANKASFCRKSLTVADRMEGLMLFDISDPYNCVFLANYNTAGDTYDVIENGDNFFIADGINGILKVKREKQGDFMLEKAFNDGALYNKLLYSPVNDVLYAGCGKDGIKMLK
jgi:hypothetical protein